MRMGPVGEILSTHPHPESRARVLKEMYDKEVAGKRRLGL